MGEVKRWLLRLDLEGDGEVIRMVVIDRLSEIYEA